MVQKCLQKKWEKYIPCDEIAMAIALDKDVAIDCEKVYATVELHSGLTRGQMVIDWQGVLTEAKPNVTIVTSIDTDKYRKLLQSATQ